MITEQMVVDLKMLCQKLHAHWGEWTDLDASELLALDYAVEALIPVAEQHPCPTCDPTVGYVCSEHARVLVPVHIHPLDTGRTGAAIVNLLANPPSAEKFDDPNDYYQHWWERLLDAALGVD